MSEQTKEKIKEQSFEDEIDLLVLFKAIWEKRIFIFISTSIISLASIIYALSLTNYYTSESILNIRDSQDSSMVNNSFGLTSMVGLNLFGQSNEGASEIIELIQSREFVKRLIRFEDVLPSLLAIEHAAKLTTSLPVTAINKSVSFKEASSTNNLTEAAFPWNT